MNTSLLDHLEETLAADVLDPEYPIEMVDEALRKAGGDPKEIGERGLELVKMLLERRKLKTEVP